MNEEIQPLVTDDLGEFEKQSIQLRDLLPTVLKGTNRIYLDSMKKNQNIASF